MKEKVSGPKCKNKLILVSVKYLREQVNLRCLSVHAVGFIMSSLFVKVYPKSAYVELLDDEFVPVYESDEFKFKYGIIEG